ncbi:MAG: protein kinase [Deltaproteobacteria bacterium]|nr:protein kinase [Deltaproteobacteria bacterium]
MNADRCQKCGAELQAGAKFCGVCGQAIPSSPSRPVPVAKTLFMGSGAVGESLAKLQRQATEIIDRAHPDQPQAAAGPGQVAAPVTASSDQMRQNPAPEGVVQPPRPKRTDPYPDHPKQPQRQAQPQPLAQPQQAQPQQAQPSVQPQPLAQPQQAQPSVQPQPLAQSNQDQATAEEQPAGAMAKLKATGSLIDETLNGRYEVLSRIGEGGFGSIYKARHIQTDRQVALKVLNPFMSSDPKLVERFRREAKAACNLRDPHTIVTYDFDQTSDGVLYIAMEYLQGQTLYELLDERERLSPIEALHVIDQCCSSLSEAHALGIVHRDIKPENIFLEPRPTDPLYTKILDFGIAKIISGDKSQSTALTAAGQTLGTLEYMSPEQLRGKPLDGRSDIYALGILGYEMLTGILPFEGDTPADIIKWHLKDAPTEPSAAAPDAGISADIDRIIVKMVAKEPDERYSDVNKLRQDIDRTLQPAAKPQPEPHNPTNHPHAMTVALIVGGVLAIMALTAFALIWFKVL